MGTATGASATLRIGPITNGQVMSAAALIFLLPNLLFTADLKGPSAWAVIAGAIAATVLVVNRPGQGSGTLWHLPANLMDLSFCLVLGMILVLLGGEGHLVFSNSDWFWRDAVLADLVRSHGLPLYNVNGALWILRAPLGLYLTPALVGKALGLGAAHAAMATQNGILAGLILFGFSLLMPRRRAARLAVIMAFSGLDIIGTLMIHRLGPSISPIDLPSHLSAWTFWQYSSQITQIFWVPNHGLPGWWLALLVLLSAQGEVSLGFLGLAFATTMFWSPLPAIGAAPFVIALFIRRPLGHLRDKWLWAHFLTSLLFLPVAIYLVIGAGSIAHNIMPHNALWMLSYIFFECLELALPVCVVLNWKNNPAAFNMPTVVAIGVLLVLPTIIFGPGDDLVMRGSIPALTLLAFMASGLIVDGGSARLDLRLVAGALVALGACTGVSEIARTVVFPRFAISSCDFMTVQDAMDASALPYHYLLRPEASPGWLIRIPPSSSAVAPQTRNCWPDFPFDPRLMVGQHSTRELLQSERNAQTTH